MATAISRLRLLCLSQPDNQPHRADLCKLLQLDAQPIRAREHRFHWYHHLVEVDVQCPYCGEPTVVVVDEAGGRTIEDCTVCCRPIDVFTTIDVDGQPQVEVSRQDE